jgi:hypothetical protein
MLRVVAILEGVPRRELSRKDLDGVLVAEGYFPQNTLRAIRSLSRRRLVSLREGSSKEESIVRLPREVRRVSEDEIAVMLKEIGGRS